MEKVCVIIDAGNFYHLVLKKLNIKELDFDFEKFVNFLVGEREIIKEGKRFYIATVRENHEGKKSMSRQTTLFTVLSRSKWVIETSKLKSRTERIKVDSRMVNYQKLLNSGIKSIEYIRAREKGIDVKMATDLIVGAIDKKYDTIILISSDTDLVPALDFVRFRFKTKIEYIGFSILKSNNYEETKPVLRMIDKTDTQRVLVESDIRPFIIKKLF